MLWTYDAYSAQTPNMYKPVPFFMSNRGYGVFVHTSAPLTFDLGSSHDGAAVLYLGDDQLDLFSFFGSPKEVLSEYTAITGRAPLPPLWTFGLWMGRQTYSSENSDGGMVGTLRGGLSLGLCGFSFWSHFIGGFPYATPEDLYRRWLAFGVLTSHSRCHGSPPTEPWEYDERFVDDFRRMVELRYRLMPYVYAQAAHACRQGHPMLRTLFFEYPEDRTSWLVEDEYFFGTDILVAPLMEEARSRDVYLPPGLWSDYQDGETYEGARWHHVHAGEVPVVMLVRDGAAVPHARLAQSTGSIEWDEIELKVFATGDSAEGYFCHPEERRLHDLRLACGEDGFELEEDPLGGRVNWAILTGRSSRE